MAVKSEDSQAAAVIFRTDSRGWSGSNTRLRLLDVDDSVNLSRARTFRGLSCQSSTDPCGVSRSRKRLT